MWGKGKEVPQYLDDTLLWQKLTDIYYTTYILFQSFFKEIIIIVLKYSINSTLFHCFIHQTLKVFTEKK